MKKGKNGKALKQGWRHKMNVSLVYRCKNCGQNFRKDTYIEIFCENLEKQLEVSEKEESIIDTFTDAAYPLKTLHQCKENEYGIGTLIRVELT